VIRDLLVRPALELAGQVERAMPWRNRLSPMAWAYPGPCVALLQNYYSSLQSG
jgi:hypothetical protein